MSNFESLLVFLFIGLIAGWLAGVLMKGRGYGVLGDIAVGIIGAEVGGWIFGRIGFTSYGLIGTVLMAVFGAVVLLTVVKLLVNAGTSKTV